MQYFSVEIKETLKATGASNKSIALMARDKDAPVGASVKGFAATWRANVDRDSLLLTKHNQNNAPCTSVSFDAADLHVEMTFIQIEQAEFELLSKFSIRVSYPTFDTF